ncbi:hypothetical protein JQN72_01090 [Phycicoccus sp. CSK15P-2]|uniref:hypothetical protein n=1 Tax=Phycicoccus sp. CSK15P-2 TaxID=2807627 RepID=UPI001951AD0F|nr:hypothetical protein [Phycicoccus sp. CSK15P-2]MBM6402840.1 hypothetical protein [Phycicoccus sp. CSK15P-2]
MKLRAIILALVAVFGLGLATAGPASAEDVTVSIHKADGVDGVKVAAAIDAQSDRSRGDFVRESVAAAFDAAGGNHTVVMSNLSPVPDASFSSDDTRLYANVKYGDVYYGMWIVDGGSFTRNGDGGYINWAFKGWYDRDGMTIHVR